MNGSFSTKTSSGAGSCRRDGGDRVGHRAEVDRDVLGLGDHPAPRVEQRGGAVPPLLDVRGERGADEDGAHLVGDRAERGAYDLELDVHRTVSARSVTPS